MIKLPGSASHVASVARDDRGKSYLVLTPWKGTTEQDRLVIALGSTVDSMKATEMAKNFNKPGSFLAGGRPLDPDEIPELH